MRRYPVIFLGICILEICFIIAVELLFPDILSAHPVAFILGGILLMVFVAYMILLYLYREERLVVRRAERELEKTKLAAQIDLVLRGIGGGFAIVKDDAEKTFVYVSESLAALLGYTKEELVERSGNRLSGIVFEEDFSIFSDCQGEESDVLRFRVYCKDGSLKWISSRGKIVVDEKGERQRYSFNHDITPLMENQKRLRELTATLRKERQIYRDALLYNCDYAYIVNVDKNKVQDVYKSGFLEKYRFDPGLSYDEAISRVAETMKPVILHGASQFHLTSHYIAAYEQGKRTVEVEYYIPDMDMYKKKSIFISRDEESKEMYVFVVAHDVTAERREALESEKSLAQLVEVAKKIGVGDLNVKIDVNVPGQVGVLADVLSQMVLNLKWHTSKLKEQAFKDPMTGVKNKRVWQEEERRLNAEIKAGTALFAIAVCDINGLKQVNDTVGHEAGDRLIIRACRHICEIFKHSPVYRIGGDEFAVILEKSDLSNCEKLVHSFYADMEGGPQGEQKEPPVSIALGVSRYQPGDVFSDVFHRADDAMYRKKAAMKAAVRSSK